MPQCIEKWSVVEDEPLRRNKSKSVHEYKNREPDKEQPSHLVEAIITAVSDDNSIERNEDHHSVVLANPCDDKLTL